MYKMAPMKAMKAMKASPMKAMKTMETNSDDEPLAADADDEEGCSKIVMGLEIRRSRRGGGAGTQCSAAALEFPNLSGQYNR